jgi:thioredoxin-like negative regulator of GroEL
MNRVSSEDVDPFLLAALELSGRKLAEGRRDQAVVALKAALRSRPLWTTGRLSLARLYLSLGQIEEAKNVLSSDLVQKQPEANLLYGRIEAHSGHLAKAERLFCRAAREMPGDPEPVFRQAEILQRRGQDDKSITLLRALSKLDKGNNHRSLADEFKRSFFALEFEKAFWCGERLLDLTTGPERSYAMRWPSLAEEFDLTYAGRLYHERALKLLDHMVAKREYTN